MRFVQDTGGTIDSQSRAQRNLRALFLSDIHLGSRACRSDRLIEFLRYHRAGAIYLVGDIVDGWRLRIELVLAARARRGPPGTVARRPAGHARDLRAGQPRRVPAGLLRHALRRHRGRSIPTIHTAADGRRYLVIHGDGFDRLVDRHARLGADGARCRPDRDRRQLGLNRDAAPVRSRRPGRRSQWAKLKFKDREPTIWATSRRRLAELAHHQAVDGVICGHVHHATIHDELGIRYINCGDWVESCTAVAERGTTAGSRFCAGSAMHVRSDCPPSAGAGA